jgi:predicted small secreted protein
VFREKFLEPCRLLNVADAWFDRKEIIMNTAKNTLKFAGLGLITLMAAACNTVAGAGEDIQAGGDAIEDPADEVKEEMSN